MLSLSREFVGSFKFCWDLFVHSQSPGGRGLIEFKAFVVGFIGRAWAGDNQPTRWQSGDYHPATYTFALVVAYVVGDRV